MSERTEKGTSRPKPAAAPRAEFRAEPAPVEVKPSGKAIPERLRLKREIQANNLAG